MLQFPTNIYPQNVAFDPAVSDEKSALSFVFNGDILTTASFRVYNYMTGELVSESYYAPQTRQPWKYNGETVSFANGTLGSGLSAGNDYVIQMLLTQGNTSDLIYDMPVVRGEIQDGSSGTSIMIEDKINNIYEWTTYNGLNIPTTLNGYRAAGMIIKIGTETRMVESYNKATGELIVNIAFATTPSEGDSYIIYSNYLVTPQYYFQCRTTPQLTETATIYSFSPRLVCAIETLATYTQSQGSMIKYYTFDLYWYDSEISVNSIGWRHLNSSPNVYSQDIKWWFINPLIGVDNIGSSISDVSDTWYKIVCTAYTQEGMAVVANEIIHLETNASESAFTNTTFTAETIDATMPDYVGRNKHQTIKLNYKSITPNSSFVLTIYRRDLETNEVVYVGVAGGVASPDYVSDHILYDYLVPNKGRFEYVCVPRLTTGEPYVKAIKKATIDVDFTGYTITALTDVQEQYGFYSFAIGDCWKFVGEIESTTVSQNLSRTLHVGTGKYSSTSSGDTDYLSGTLSAMIGAVNCETKKYTDTIDMVKAWRRFLSENDTFLLKSQKGDVWIVNITDIPTTNYEENSPTIPTTFSFSWAECLPLEKVLIR